MACTWLCTMWGFVMHIQGNGSKVRRIKLHQFESPYGACGGFGKWILWWSCTQHAWSFSPTFHKWRARGGGQPCRKACDVPPRGLAPAPSLLAWTDTAAVSKSWPEQVPLGLRINKPGHCTVALLVHFGGVAALGGPCQACMSYTSNPSY